MADGEITTTLSELDRNKDGKVDSRMETFYRGGVKVLMVYSRADTNGVMKVGARTYFVNGDIVLSEGDDDGDGFFETIVASHPDTKDLEVFIRTTEGVRPASTRTVDAHKKQVAAVAEFFQELSEETTDSEIDKRFRDARKKIEDAEREKEK